MDAITYVGLDVHKATISVALAEGGVQDHSYDERIKAMARQASASVKARGASRRLVSRG